MKLLIYIKCLGRTVYVSYVVCKHEGRADVISGALSLSRDVIAMRGMFYQLLEKVFKYIQLLAGYGFSTQIVCVC